MILIKNSCTDPYFNMACEEHLLMSRAEPLLMLWRNEPSVIIGKNQNARDNVNFGFADANGIKVVRRLTGGGAVFHDLGNINYTFIVPQSDAPSDFSAFSAPVLHALASLGIQAEASGRNDLTANGRKFSGTARCEYIYKGKKSVMHHGTLLFSADFSKLSGALIFDPEKFRSKGIKSTVSRVINLKELLPEQYKNMDAESFIKYLENFFLSDGATEEDLSSDDIIKIKELADNKYKTDKWLFSAENSGFDTERKARFPFGSVCIKIRCKENEVGYPYIIENVRIEGDFIGQRDISYLENALKGTPFERGRLISLFSDININEYITGATADDISSLIFG